MPRPALTRRATAALRRSRSALGGVAAQVSQALASLVLQVLVARTLGEVGLATYALLYGGLVLATAVVTGLVGDTLTVVDRAVPRTRAGLQWWSALLALALGAVGALVTRFGTDIGLAGALAFGAAVAAFLVEDVLRRLLMACDRFWSVVVVDTAALLGSGISLVVAAATGGTLGLPAFLVALAVGQVVACVVATALLPSVERRLAPWHDADLRVVLGFGAWRAAQQVLRPGMLTAARLVVVAAVGAAAYGQLEAARLLATPLILVVSGTGNVLLVGYARARSAAVAGDPGEVARSLRRADAAAAALVGLAVVVGSAATAAAPLLAPLVTAGAFALEPAAVGAWVVYAATSAVLLPYAVLASVSGLQRSVFLVRSLDSAASVGLVLVLLLVAGGPVWAVPVALSVGSLLSAVALRLRVGARRRRGAAAPPPTAAAS